LFEGLIGPSKLYDLILNNAPSLTFFSLSNAGSAPLGELKPEELFPENRGYYTYSGSLTPMIASGWPTH